MFNPNNRAGQWFQRHRRRVMNRTGAVAVVGDVLALDMLGTDAATAAGDGVAQDGTLDVQDAIYHNVVAVAAGNIDGLSVIVISLLSGAGADNTELEVALCDQRIQCQVNGNSVNIAVGDSLIPVAASDALVKLAAAGEIPAVAYALEASTTDADLIDVTFFGGMPKTFSGAAS